MLPQVVYSGVISGASGSVLTDSSATWADGDYASADPNGNPSYYAEITNHTDSTKAGTILEILSSSGSAKTLSVGADVTGLDGASYAIRKFRSLADVFGSDNSVGLTAGTSATNADVVYKIGVNNGTTEWQLYYYQQTIPLLGGNGWRKLGDKNTDMSGASIFPDEGLLVFRRSPGDLSITLPGSIKTHNSRTTILNGINVLSPSYPVDLTLDDLEFKSQLQSGSSVTNSDVIYVVNSQGLWDLYYYQTAPPVIGGNGWRKAGDTSTDQKSTIIAAGSSFLLHRRGVGLEWSATKPF
jgi:hypothetical protein